MSYYRAIIDETFMGHRMPSSHTYGKLLKDDSDGYCEILDDYGVTWMVDDQTVEILDGSGSYNPIEIVYAEVY